MEPRRGDHGRALLGGVVYLFAAEYFVAEQVAAVAWSTPPYSWSSNYISDLGLTSCSPSVCSPRHAVMNAGFVALGAMIGLGSVLLRKLMFAGRLGSLALALMVLSGVGDVLVGLFPGSVDPGAGGSTPLHALGAALAIIGGNTGILLCGVALWRRNRILATYSMLSGALGLVALALFAADVHLGLGIGTMERLAADPIVVWLVVLGAVTLTRRRAARSPG